MQELVQNGVFAACADLLARVEGAYLDCVSDDLALLLARHGVADIRSPFAQDWRFDVVERAGALPRLDLPPAAQADLLAERTGWRPQWHPIRSIDDALPRWHRALSYGRPVLLLGDAFHLRWVPYCGHEHMDHGFVLEGLEPSGSGPVAWLVDPYDNATAWGRATPLATRVPVSALADAMAGGRWAVLEPAGPATPTLSTSVVRANATAIVSTGAAGGYDRFIASHQPLGLAELTNLALQTWLVARNRALHARWLAGLPAQTVEPALVRRFAALVVGGWQRAREMSYVALRRVQSGRPAPSGALTALQAVAHEEVRMAEVLLDADDDGDHAGPGASGAHDPSGGSGSARPIEATDSPASNITADPSGAP